MREDVVKDVMTQAKNERWGVPAPCQSGQIASNSRVICECAQKAMCLLPTISNTLISITTRLTKKKFDLRANELYENANQTYLDVTDDRYRLRTRARVSIDAKITELTKASIRLATGSSKIRFPPIRHWVTKAFLGTYLLIAPTSASPIWIWIVTRG